MPLCEDVLFTFYGLMLIFAVRTFYYSMGTQLYCAPTVDARPEWQSTMQHIALEGRCFVLSACQYAQVRRMASDLCAH